MVRVSAMVSGPQLADCAASKATDKQNILSSVTPRRVSPTSDRDLILATLARQKAHRDRVFSQDLPFSWLRLIVGLISVAFVLTDVPRSGLGVSDLSKYYPTLETDTTIASGIPWAYPVFRATRQDAANTSVRIWSYKFDTTSIVWRALAQHLSVTEFPDCIQYRTRCPTSVMSGSVVFTFIDKLVEAVADKLRPPLPPKDPRTHKPALKMMLRTESEFFDRVHDFLLPSMFLTRIWRTNEAVFYPAHLVQGMDASQICFGSPRPFFCHQLWINFDRSCPRDLQSCRQVGHVYTHTMHRMRAVQEQFPNDEVDLTFFTSSEDLQVSRLSLSIEGNRRADISTVIRARRCSSIPSTQTVNEATSPSEVELDCETIYVEDYRYEIDILVSDVAQWYLLLACLRLVGQGYFFLRALALVISCYYAFGPQLSRTGETATKRWRKTIHLLSKVPTQCIVFGSPFPILCYTVAHSIDAAIMYRILEKRFISQNGVLDLSVREFVTVAVIQMRSVWVYAMLLHLIVKSATWHRWTGWSSDSVIGGITGVPEFLLTAMASITIVAQFRSTRFRSTRIFFLRETAGSESVKVMLRQHLFTHQGNGKDHLGGVIIDIKFLTCIVVILVIISLCRVVLIRIKSGRSGWRNREFDTFNWPLGRTPVPYSAGILWPSVSLCVHWTSDFFCIREIDDSIMLSRRRQGQSMRIAPVATPTSQSVGHLLRRQQTFVHAATPSIRMSARVLRSIQHQMESLHNRSNEVEGNVAFMNLVIMSDLIVYYHLLVDSRKNLAYYQSQEHPDKVVLLPEAAVTAESEPMCQLRKLKQVHMNDLDWSELVQCG